MFFEQSLSQSMAHSAEIIVSQVVIRSLHLGDGPGDIHERRKEPPELLPESLASPFFERLYLRGHLDRGSQDKLRGVGKELRGTELQV